MNLQKFLYTGSQKNKEIHAIMNRCVFLIVMLLAVVLATGAVWAETVGSEFQVNIYTADYQWLPTVGMDGLGNFVIIWHSDGQNVVIQFKSTFEKKSSAIEAITPMIDEDGKWRMSGYFMK